MYPLLRISNNTNKAGNLSCCLATLPFKVIVEDNNVVKNVVHIDNNFNAAAYNCKFVARKVKRN